MIGFVIVLALFALYVYLGVLVAASAAESDPALRGEPTLWICTLWPMVVVSYVLYKLGCVFWWTGQWIGRRLP